MNPQHNPLLQNRTVKRWIRFQLFLIDHQTQRPWYVKVPLGFYLPYGIGTLGASVVA